MVLAIGAKAEEKKKTITNAQAQGWAVVDAPDGPDAPAGREIDYAQIMEDTDIMAKIIDKTLDKRWPKKYEPSTLFRQSLGCQGIYLKGYGAVFVTNINFPVAERAVQEETEPPPDDLWQQTKSELRKGPSGINVTYGPVFGDNDARLVGTLKEILLRLIAEYGHNVRQLGPQENVVIVVRGTSPVICDYYIYDDKNPTESKMEIWTLKKQLNDAGVNGKIVHEVKEPLKPAKLGSDVVTPVKPPASKNVDAFLEDAATFTPVTLAPSIRVINTQIAPTSGKGDSGRTTLIIKISKKLIMEYKDGSLDFEDFAKRAEVTQY